MAWTPLLCEVDDRNVIEIALEKGGIANYTGTYLEEMQEDVTVDNLEETLRNYENPEEAEQLIKYFAEMFE